MAETAGAVLQLAGSGAVGVDDCLARGEGGASQAGASALASQAGRLAGPYSVDLSGPSTPTPSGQPVPLLAHVTSATGYPVPGLTVTFVPGAAGLRVTSGSATTDANGDARVQAITSTTQVVPNAAVTASVQAPVGLLGTSADGQVTLVRAAAPQVFSDRLPLAVNTKPDPHLSLADDQQVLLSGGELGQTLGVTGMNGHAGAATVSLYGPLALPANGCSALTQTDWTAAQTAGKIIAAPQITIPGDGTFRVPAAPDLAPGCYRAVASLTTTDAVPNVSTRSAGPVLTVAPVSVRAAAPYDGLAPAGSLHTTLRATSGLAATWQNVQGDVLGPRLAVDGHCPSTGWDTAPTAAEVTSTGSSTSSTGDGTLAAGTASSAAAVPPTSTTATSDTAAVTVGSGNVTKAGCYAFSLTATLRLPGIGSTTLRIPPGAQSTPVHVITPIVSVTSLSTKGVDSGGHLSAVVHVDASDGQPGSVRLQLLRLPYTYRGCFAADWSDATIVGQMSRAPAAATDGDNTYRVSTAAVPGSACWTVVPVFTARANPAVQAQATAGTDPMLAFTSTLRPVHDGIVSGGPRAGNDLAREIVTGAAVLAVIVLLLAGIGIGARRGRSTGPTDPADRLLS